MHTCEKYIFCWLKSATYFIKLSSPGTAFYNSWTKPHISSFLGSSWENQYKHIQFICVKCYDHLLSYPGHNATFIHVLSFLNKTKSTLHCTYFKHFCQHTHIVLLHENNTSQILTSMLIGGWCLPLFERKTCQIGAFRLK